MKKKKRKNKKTKVDTSDYYTEVFSKGKKLEEISDKEELTPFEKSRENGETLKKIHKNFVGSFGQIGPAWVQYLNVIVGFYGWFEIIFLKSDDQPLFYQFLHWWTSLQTTGEWVLIILTLIPVIWIIGCIGLWFPSFVVVTVWLFIKDKKVPWS